MRGAGPTADQWRPGFSGAGLGLRVPDQTGDRVPRRAAFRHIPAGELLS